MLTIAQQTTSGEPTPWFFIIAALQFIANTAFAVAMFWVGGKAKRIDTLEADIKSSAQKAIDSQVKLAVSELRSVTAVMTAQIDQISDRLRSGDSEFKGLGKQDHVLELKFTARMDELKEYIRQTCAGKSDMQVLTKDVEALKVEMARRG